MRSSIRSTKRFIWNNWKPPNRWLFYWAIGFKLSHDSHQSPYPPLRPFPDHLIGNHDGQLEVGSQIPGVFRQLGQGALHRNGHSAGFRCIAHSPSVLRPLRILPPTSWLGSSDYHDWFTCISMEMAS